MRKVLCASLLASLFSLAAVASGAPRIHDHAAEFLTFWDEVRDLPLDEQVAGFHTEVVPGFPEFYRYKFARWERDGLVADERLAQVLAVFPDIEESFRHRAETIVDDIERALVSFKQQFPDFDDGVDVHLMHSLFEMDGGGRTIDGETYFIFGIDGIVRYHDTQDDTPFFHHELFHFYQHQRLTYGGRMVDALWAEGLATYVSHVLNPDADWRALMLDLPTGLVAACEEHRQRLVEDLLEKLESRDDRDYRSYFLLNAGHPEVPERAGYYIGYLVAERLHATMTLDEMVDLEGARLLTAVREALGSLRP